MTRGKIVSVICIVYLLCAGISNCTRTKRELRLPKGSSLVLAVAAVTFLPKGPTDGLAHFVEFDLGFPFPDVLSKPEPEQRISWKPSYKKVMKKYGTSGIRGKRNVKDEERRNLIWKLEDTIDRLGYNGTSCMLRFRCELRYVFPGNSLLEKLLTVLFKTSEYGDGKCENYVNYCPISLLKVIMNSVQISGTNDMQ